MKINNMKKALLLLISLCLAFFSTPITVKADVEDPEHRYVAFASDVYGDKDKLVKALTGLPDNLEYISLVGDMVAEENGQYPEYNTSEFFGPLFDMYENIMARFFSIIWADHDVNAEDDAQVLYAVDGHNSGELYEMLNADGSSAYFIYAVGYYHMTAGGPESMEAAEAFKHWVRKKPPTVPIIVVGHVPIWAGRGDNLGATYWNEALNYAATGVEGITELDDSQVKIRDVFYVCGHNFDIDNNEYMYLAGTKMPVQIDTTQYANQLTANFGTYNSEVVEEGNAKSVESSIYYTTFTGGYVTTNEDATLMDIDETYITFTKYSNGNEVSLGINGATGEEMGSSVTIKRIQLSDEGGPVITKQPEDAVVHYPEGATFTVEVEDPDSIASYQWCLLDKENNLFILEGVTADNPTLVIPSTQRRDSEMRFYCIVTNKEGLKTVTKQAKLSIDNGDVNKPVFYVGEYHLEPGETMDLSKVDIGEGHLLGSGIVTFDENGTDITLDNVHYDNTYTTCDIVMAPNVGLDMEYDSPEDMEFNVTFIGENQLINTYYNLDYNLGGIPFDYYFTGEVEQRSLVNFIGDGTLEIVNGTNAIRVIADLCIDIDITVRQNRVLYADGIWGYNMRIAPGVTLNLDVNGYGLFAPGNMLIEDAEININSRTPHISAGTVTKQLITAGNVLLVDNSVINMKSVSDQAICGTAAGIALIYSAGDMYILNGSEINGELDAVGDGFVAFQSSGFFTKNGYFEDSTINIKIDSEHTADCCGMFAEEYYEIVNSEVNVDIKASGTVYGVLANGDFSADDSKVDVKTANYPYAYDRLVNYALVCENAVFRATKPENTASFTAEDGIAVILDPDLEPSLDPVGYQEGYETANVFLREGTECLVPEENAVSLTSFYYENPDFKGYAVIEAYYDLNDTSKPASKAVFGIREEEEPEDVVYTIVEGDGGSHEIGSDEGLEFVIKRSVDDEETFELFKQLLVDDKEVDPDNYTAESGSVIINLDKEYLDTLEEGEHTLTAVFEDGEVSGKFSITKKEQEEPDEPVEPDKPVEPDPDHPETGDNNDLLRWTLLLRASTTAGYVVYRKKKELE